MPGQKSSASQRKKVHMLEIWKSDLATEIGQLTNNLGIKLTARARDADATDTSSYGSVY